MIAFGGNMSSQLFQEIREKYGLCYYISAEHYSHQEYGIFMIRAGLAKHQSTFAEQKITSLLDILMNQGITEEQLGHTKNYLRGILQMGLETSDQIVHFLSSQRLTTGKILTLEEVM